MNKPAWQNYHNNDDASAAEWRIVRLHSGKFVVQVFDMVEGDGDNWETAAYEQTTAEGGFTRITEHDTFDSAKMALDALQSDAGSVVIGEVVWP